MENIWMLTDKLSAAIKDSREYREFHEYKEILEKRPQLMHMVNSIRKQNFEIQNMYIEDTNRWYEESWKLNEAYKNLEDSTIVNKFLMAEINLCRMIQTVYKDIVKELDLGINFLE
ncbi:MAG: YlbF family regulator [Lachnospiraceae bacterium]|nr:YlbF family regulator [Lachnospira sp.]MBR6697249.1 YlbF family regulator [Lachnospiraceae bacterium]